jgi:hypothetical protein
LGCIAATTVCAGSAKAMINQSVAQFDSRIIFIFSIPPTDSAGSRGNQTISAGVGVPAPPTPMLRRAMAEFRRTSGHESSNALAISPATNNLIQTNENHDDNVRSNVLENPTEK